MYAIASVFIGWAVDHYNWPRTYVLSAASLLLAAMYIVQVSPVRRGVMHLMPVDVVALHERVVMRRRIPDALGMFRQGMICTS